MTSATPTIGQHDVGGRINPDWKLPRDRSYAQWEVEVHALLVWLVKNKLMSVDELRRATEALEPELYSNLSYYEKWTASMTTILIGKGIVTRQQIEDELRDAQGVPPATAQVRFRVGDRVRVLPESLIRRWRRPHLRIPGYVHGAVGTVLGVIGAFEDPAYAAFAEKAPAQPLYRVAFRAGDVWGSTAAAKARNDLVEADIFQQWLAPANAPGSAVAAAAPLGFVPPAPYDTSRPSPQSGVKSQPAAAHGHSHGSREETECKAVAAEPADFPLRPLADALMRTLAAATRNTSTPFSRNALRATVEKITATTDANLGSALVAKAWVDPGFKARLLADPGNAAAECGISTSNYGGADVSMYPGASDAVTAQIRQFSSGHTELRVVECTDALHHVVVCTLCSCYPVVLLGLSPEWYKSRYYRARAVRDPRGLLRDDFGLEIGAHRRVVVHDSTAEVRYLVLPRRPAGTDGWSEQQLRAIVSRDSMVGVAEVPPQLPGAKL